MSFEKSKVNFTVIEFTEGCDREKLLNNIMNESYLDSTPSVGTPVTDFTSGVSLASISGDEEITEDEFVTGGLPHFAIRTRELKLDSSLIRETVDRRLHDIEKQGTPINSKLKRQIKEEVTELFEDDAVLKISGNRCMFPSPSMKIMLTDATSTKKVEEVIMEHMMTSIEMGTFGPGNSMFRMSPEYLYTMITGKPTDAYIPVRMNGFDTIDSIGHDFLTYLFMASEVQDFFDDGTILKLHGDIELEDCRESMTGAKKVSLKEGCPSISDEVVSALSSGKKVKSADIMISFGGEVYTVNVDKDFFFKKLVLEEEKNLDPHSQFQARANSINLFIEGFKKVFGKFVSSEDVNEKFILGWLKERQSNVGIGAGA